MVSIGARFARRSRVVAVALIAVSAAATVVFANDPGANDPGADDPGSDGQVGDTATVTDTASAKKATTVSDVVPDTPPDFLALDDAPIGSIHDLAIASESDELEDLTRRCLPLFRVRKMEALTEYHVLVTLKDRSKFLVQFNRCPGLRERATLSYNSNGSRLCALDGIRPITGLGASQSVGPSCQIPGFEPVSDEQVEYVLAEYTSWKAARRRQ